ncbi:MAG: hypothetical protein EZS28_017927 [Streblomastix strix]|uniref:FPL domain-containing protein n=1 Tax=Streblomastix strix TaxID=222440 RepID=A0A5J4VVH6_9EUKA|nr:MAG: hypothetical protein EZS28_017927 [Streblomastix strix]
MNWAQINVRQEELDEQCHILLNEAHSVEVDERILAIKRLVHLVINTDKAGFITELDIFDSKLLPAFAQVLSSNCESVIKMEIFQAITFLLANMKNETTFFYLLSNNRIYNLLRKEKVDINDNDLVSYYASVLRTLSFKITTENLPLFLVNSKEMPIFSLATDFIDYPDNIVKAVVRTTLLNILKLNNQQIPSQMNPMRQQKKMKMMNKKIIFISNKQEFQLTIVSQCHQGCSNKILRFNQLNNYAQR